MWMATNEAVSYFSVWLWIMRSLFKNPMVICFLWSEFSLQNQLTSPNCRLFSCRSWREEIKEVNTHLNYMVFFSILLIIQRSSAFLDLNFHCKSSRLKIPNGNILSDKVHVFWEGLIIHRRLAKISPIL